MPYIPDKTICFETIDIRGHLNLITYFSSTFLEMPRFNFDYTKMTLANGEAPKPLTINMYRAALNKIASVGYTDRDDLLTDPESIIKVIDDMFPTNQKRRVALSAVFRVLGDVPNEYRMPYYEYFQKCKDIVE